MKKIIGNNIKPRISIFRSNKQIYAQVIDDSSGKTLTSFSSKKLKKNKKTKVEKSYEVGRILGLKMKKLNINKSIFDKKKYLYHGRVKNLADGIRKTGIKF